MLTGFEPDRRVLRPIADVRSWRVLEWVQDSDVSAFAAVVVVVVAVPTPIVESSAVSVPKRARSLSPNFSGIDIRPRVSFGQK